MFEFQAGERTLIPLRRLAPCRREDPRGEDFMLRSCLTVTLLLAMGMVPAFHGAAQIPVADWTERPDSRAPAGIVDDVLLRRGQVEVLYNLSAMSYEDLLAGTDEVPPILVLTGAEPNWPAFDAVPLSGSTQRHELEVRMGILSWLGASIRVPWVMSSIDFATNQLRGSPSTSGVGDVELHVLYGLHDQWPYRAHVGAGVSLPTGSVDERGRMPDDPGIARILPYPMQPGDGTLNLLPAAVFVAENEAGTVGLRANARIPIGKNDREWTRGTVVEGHVWMAYRFTDWVSGSARISFRNIGNLSGFDPSVNRWSTPPANPDLQRGTRAELPLGVNFYFPEGPLRGNRLRAEFILPVHQDLDGPQLRARYGAAFSWGITF